MFLTQVAEVEGHAPVDLQGKRHKMRGEGHWGNSREKAPCPPRVPLPTLVMMTMVR